MPPVPSKDDPLLHGLVVGALARLEAELRRTAPFMAEPVGRWIRRGCGGAEPVATYLHPRSFPLLQLPYWLAGTLQGEIEPDWHADLVYSSLNGYYFIRLIDNVMDGDVPGEAKLLPAAAFFHSQFQRVYQRHFPAEHPFWNWFDTLWTQSAEATLRDAMLKDVTERDFLEVAARKFCAAKIPVVAVGYHCERSDLIEPWVAFVGRLGGWYQMANDFFDWHHDGRFAISTYFRSEAERRKRPEEPLAVWFVREGFDWGTALLGRRLGELERIARGLNSGDLNAFMRQHEAHFEQQRDAAASGVDGLRSLVVAFG